ncbi:MAG TPA: DJ-1/PfpI family protein, partial [Aminobacteriaceae bacterium]|nr:DJ-1/PfpI family protein [Aminobacteriaceae bacterium]
MAKSVLAVLAEGFEEIEAITPVDVLRRLDVDVTVASLDGLVVKGARGISVQADTTLAEVAGRTFDLIVLPGGMPGAA